MKRLCLPLLAVISFLGTAVQADNQPPVVGIVATHPFIEETIQVAYILYDEDDNAVDGKLTYGLYFYPDAGLVSVQDIRIFATTIANEKDVTLPEGTGLFSEGDSAEEVVLYTWGEHSRGLRMNGFAPLTKIMEGQYYIYLVADDGVNDPVFTVAGPIKVDRSAPAPTAVSSKSWGSIKNVR